MSFILDALKRADQERRQDGTPSIAIAHSIAPDEPLTDRRTYTMGLMWVGSALAVVVLAVWISVTLSTRLSIQALSDSPVTSVITAEIIDTPRNVTATSRPQPATSKPTLDQNQALATDTLPHPEISALYQAADTTNNTSKAVQRLYIPEVPEPAVAPPQPAKVERPKPSPRAQELLAAHIPQIHELPRALQQSIPSIHYRDHHFHNGPDSRVVLNGQELRVGAQLDQDLRVDDILDDGVVLSFKGQSFKLRARNSWINM